jgi:hypothetical protein
MPEITAPGARKQIESFENHVAQPPPALFECVAETFLILKEVAGLISSHSELICDGTCHRWLWEQEKPPARAPVPHEHEKE